MGNHKAKTSSWGLIEDVVHGGDSVISKWFIVFDPVVWSHVVLFVTEHKLLVKVILILPLEYLKMRNTLVLDHQCYHRIRTYPWNYLFLICFILPDVSSLMLRQIVSSYWPIYAISTILNLAIKLRSSNKTSIVLKRTHHFNRRLKIKNLCIISNIEITLGINKFLKSVKYQFITLVLFTINNYLFAILNRTVAQR